MLSGGSAIVTLVVTAYGLVASGGTIIVSNGTTSEAVVSSGGVEIVSAGGFYGGQAIATLVSSGGLLEVLDQSQQTTIQSGDLRQSRATPAPRSCSARPARAIAADSSMPCHSAFG